MTAQLDAIGLVVADLKVAIKFYEHLGLNFGDEPDEEGHGHAEADIGGGKRLLLDSIAGIHAFDLYAPL